MLRVSRGLYFVVDCRSVEEVAAHVDLGSPVPEQRAQGFGGAAPLELAARVPGYLVRDRLCLVRDRLRDRFSEALRDELGGFGSRRDVLTIHHDGFGCVLL